ncbi:MAG: putative Ig domain-containing protein, partial [Campylobacterales bacterium]|nr:putative Ig domain-containing protein [Campylobacterales bacterium]
MNLRMVLTTLFVSLFFLSCGGGSSNNSSSSTANDTKPQDDAYAKITAFIQSEGNTTLPSTSDYANVGATGVNSQNIDSVNAMLLKYITLEYIQSSSNIEELVDSIIADSDISIDSDEQVMQTKSITLKLVNSKEVNISKIEWLDGDGVVIGTAVTLNYDAMEQLGEEQIVVRVIFEDGSVALAYRSIETIEYENVLTQIKGVPQSSINQDENYSFTPTVHNPDNDTLIFSATNLPSWLTLDTHTGKIYGTPSNSDVGIAKDINISVDD